jgi:enoyl-CoA hydratase/carnithine racemase
MKGVESTTVRFECDEDGVLLLTLNRPERNNAWTGELGSALHTLLEQAAESEAVRAIVITGAGRSFCPGLDTEDLDRVSQPGESLDQTGNRPMSFPTLVPKPIVAAINGGCAGLGLVTALMSDVRFAAEDAKITTAFARRGLPAEEALSRMLPRIVGHATALDLLLSSRVVVGSEAAQIGLVHRAFPLTELLPAAPVYARDLAINCSPIAMATAKRQVYRDWERSFVDSQQNARQLVGILRDTSPDFREGVRSLIEAAATELRSAR